MFAPRSSQAVLKTQPARATQGANWTKSSAADDVFVIYRDERGEMSCRAATKAERDAINSRSNAGPTRIIYAGAPRDSDSNAQRSESDTTPGLNLLPSAGLRIVLHGTTQLDQNPEAKNGFIVAANRWEAIISTPITVVIDVDFGSTFFGQPYPSASILGQTGSSSLLGPYSDLRERLINHASGSAESDLYNALPATELPVERFDVTSTVTSARATSANARALGIVPDITNPDALALGQGDAGIGFNSAFQFDFNPDDGITTTAVDFDAVATHEIGHALGFTSNAGGSNTSFVSIWDVFRFKPARATLATFGTTPRMMGLGGDQVFFGNQVTTFATLELALSTGGPAPGPTDGDGRQSSHWRDDSLVSNRQYIGVMDPTLARGLRRTISENDILVLDLIGYSIGLPAPVRPPNDNFANAIALTGDTGSVNGTSVNATHEAGEPAHAFFLSDKSVWYTWVAPVTGTATVDTAGSNFDTTVAVYTGSSVDQLIHIASNDDAAINFIKTSQVTFNVIGGEIYRIAVDGWNGEYGNVTFHWMSNGPVLPPSPTPTPTPSPTPTPTPFPLTDLVIDSFVISPDPVATTQFISFVVSGKNIGPGPAFSTQASLVLPSGVTFVSCLPGCTPPTGSDGGTVQLMFGTVELGAAINFSVVGQVTAGNGATLTATANLTSSVPEMFPDTNTATRSVRVVNIVPFTEAKKIALETEGNHVLALRRGTVWAWGNNHFGQLGDGTNTDRLTPVQVDDLMSVVDIDAGHNYSMALKNDGTVWTWGDNDHGSLGIGTATPTSLNRATKVPSLSSVVAISAGSGHALALKSDGTVWSWGSNALGYLGLGTLDSDPHPTPTQIPGLTGIVAIFGGDGISFALNADGTVFGWGTRGSGQLGDGTLSFESVSSPIELPALRGMTRMGSGIISTTIMKSDGTLLSFGNNFMGQLGRGLPDNGPYPVPTVIAGLAAKDVVSGYTHVIVTEPSGTLKGFGRNNSSQLGTGSSGLAFYSTPIAVPDISNVFATAAGPDSTLAITGDPVTGGIIRAWGGNTNGVLGNGSGVPSPKPAPVVENLTVATPIFSVAAGSITATQVQIVCGTPASVIHFTTNGSDPTESDPVIVSGGFVNVDQSLTLKAKAFRTDFASSVVKSATYTVVAPAVPELLLDQSGPALDQAAALDLYTFVRDPFPVLNPNDFLKLGSDRNTRVVVFVNNLQLGQGNPPTPVVVNIVGSNSQAYDVPAQDVRAIANSTFVQVSFRLPDSLAPGTCTIRIKAQAQISNPGTIRIKP
ncbi:MAG TPA: NF038122 family metalloprotease [Pyrinomonadaceae bacterium]|nr:NF038122 family metalloprotease [Pyrinomonadaceae bacterium]